MFYDDEPEVLPWDYFLTKYERDLLKVNFEELVRKNPKMNPEDLKSQMEQMRAGQVIFEGKA